MLLNPTLRFVGDGERDTTGAAEAAAARGAEIFNPPTLDLAMVRTRGDLADFINSAADPVAIKQEFIGPAYDGMNLDDSMEVEITGEFEGNRSGDYEEGNGEEEDESLLDEQGEYAEHVVSCEEGEEESEEGEEDGADQAPDAAAAVASTAGVVVSNDYAGSNNGEEEPGKNQEGETADPIGIAEQDEEGNTEERTEKNENSEDDKEDGKNDEIEPEDIDPVDPNLKPDHRFFVVRAMVAGNMEPRPLNKRMKKTDPDPGFLIEGDERWYRNANVSCTTKKLNTSASFTPRGGCHTCISGIHDAWIGRNGQPTVVVASDQHFPANLPVDGEGECIKILRVENGSLAEIARELTAAAPPDGMVPGSVVLLGATAQLAVVSVEFYAAEWKKARNFLKADLGDIVVLPMFPISASGIKDQRIIRGLIDLAAWMEDMEEPELRLLRNTRKAFEDVYLGKKERGPGWADTLVNMSLPVSLRGDSSGTTAYVTGSWGVRPTEIKALTQAGEKYWIDKLVHEANRELRVNLATTLSFNRTLSAIKRQANDVGKISMITVGASNSIRTAAALKRKGVEIMEMGRRGWTISEESVDALLEQLQITASKDDILVLQCLDSRCFMETDSNGNVHLPKRGEDGKVHVRGRIIVAKDLLLEILLDQLDPVFRSRKDSLIILVCPLTRFLLACCDAHGKGDTGESEGEGKRLLKELGTLRREIKSRLLKKGYANVRMVDPLEVCGAASSVEAARQLMADQAHMVATGYAKLAGAIKEVAHGWLLGRKRKGTGSDRPDAKRIRLDSSQLESGASRGKSGGSGGKGAGGKRGKVGRNGDGKGPASGKKKNATGGK
jgi:hypothetical protein